MINEKIKILEGYPEITQKRYLKFNMGRCLLTILWSIFSLGVLPLFIYWYKDLYFSLLYIRVESIDQADYIWFLDDDEQSTYCKLYEKEIKLFKNGDFMTYTLFNHGVHKFYYVVEYDIFLNVGKSLLRYFREEFSRNPRFYKTYQPNGSDDINYLNELFGKNEIKLEHKNIFLLTIRCLLTPLNCFEIVVIVICFTIWRPVFATQLCIYVTIQTSVSMFAERNKVTKINSFSTQVENVKVIRLDENKKRRLQTISSIDLTIGDIILISGSTLLQCDVVLISGSCNVNEAVLTGETTPVSKQPVAALAHILDENLLFSGSECLAVRGGKNVIGLVTGTGWNTFKGSLLDSMVTSRSMVFKFDRDFFIFCSFTSIFYTIIQSFLIYLDVKSGRFNLNDTFFRLMYVITAAFPPSAMLTFVISTVFAENRLNDEGVSCMKNDRIKEVGRVKVIAFDKTGTLTDEMVDVSGVVMKNASDKTLAIFYDDVKMMKEQNNVREVREFFACCNNLLEINGKIIGDSIDVQQFKKSAFTLKPDLDVEIDNDEKNLHLIESQIEKSIIHSQRNVFFSKEDATKEEKINELNEMVQEEKPKIVLPSKDFLNAYNLSDEAEYKIERLFQFTPERKRLSVLITRPKGDTLEENENENVFFCKGAPETLLKLFKKESIPDNYEEKILDYTMKGYRILAFGYKFIKKEQLLDNVQEFESDLIFLGLMLMQNNIKPQTYETIKSLKENDIHVLMITGDNVFTGINAGFASGIIDLTQKVYVCQVAEGKKLKWYFLSQNEYIKSLRLVSLENDKTENLKIAEEISRSGVNLVDQDLKARQTEKNVIDILKDCDATNSVIALEGDVFDILMETFATYEDVRERILKHTVIFGRSKPIQKQTIIKALKSKYLKRYITIGFVGDGSNDCKALNEANMGLCVGCKEAVMTASFSSSSDNISGVIPTLCLGRYMLENLNQVMKIAMFSGFMSSLSFSLICYHDLMFTHYDLANQLLYFLPVYLVVCYSYHQPKLGPFLPKPGFINAEIMSEFFIGIIVGFGYIFLSYFLLISRLEAKEVSSIVYSMKEIKHEEHFFVEGKHLMVMFAINNLFIGAAFHRSMPFKQPFYVNPYLWAWYTFSFLAQTLPYYIHRVSGSGFERFWTKFSRFPLNDDNLWMKVFSFAFLSSFFIFYVIRIVQYLQLKWKIEKRDKRRNEKLDGLK